MRQAGDLEKDGRAPTDGFVSYCVPGSFATVSRTVSTMDASSACRSARAGRAAQAFRSYKYPNEICSGVSDIYSVRAHTSEETRDLSPLHGIDSMTRRPGSARTLMLLVRQNPQLDPNGKFFGLVRHDPWAALQDRA